MYRRRPQQPRTPKADKRNGTSKAASSTLLDDCRNSINEENGSNTENSLTKPNQGGNKAGQQLPQESAPNPVTVGIGEGAEEEHTTAVATSVTDVVEAVRPNANLAKRASTKISGNQRKRRRLAFRSFLLSTMSTAMMLVIAKTVHFHFDVVFSMFPKLPTEVESPPVRKDIIDLPRGYLVPEPNFVPRNLRLCFLGDSITRYQYIDLLYYIHFGKWYDEPPSYETMHYLVRSRSFGFAYNDYFNHTTRLFAPYEQCDCRRENEQQMALARELERNGTYKMGQTVYLKGKINPKQWYENRYYWNPETNNSVSYIQAFGDLGSASHWAPETAFLEQHDPIEGDSHVHFRGNWSETITNFIARLEPKPNVLVLNSGRWPSYIFATDENLDAIQKAAKDAGIQAIYKTSTASQAMIYYIEDYEVRMCTELPCLNLSWTLFLPDKAQWDNLHFWDPYYQTMNKQLLVLMNDLGVLPDQNVTPLFLPALTDAPTPAPPPRPKWRPKKKKKKKTPGHGKHTKNWKKPKKTTKTTTKTTKKKKKKKRKKKKSPMEEAFEALGVY